MNQHNKLDALRDAMASHHLDAYIIPSADPHQSETVAAYWKSRQWISGFTGSAGTLAILTKKAGLWTDGRYFIQAEKELKGTNIALFKQQMPGTPKLIDWVSQNVHRNGRVGIDGRLISAEQADIWSKKLGKKSISLEINTDLTAPLWDDRPLLPETKIALHTFTYSGQHSAEKIATIRAEMKRKSVNAYLLSSLPDIAWLFNIRGNDIPYCPVVTAYALLTKKKAILFVEPTKCSEKTKQALSDEGIATKPYNEIENELKSLLPSTPLYLDKNRTSAWLYHHLPSANKIVSGAELTSLHKARKNKTQLKNWKTVCEHDGAAMIRFLKWLEENPNTTEYKAAKQLEAQRRQNPECLGLSFPSISAYGPNAAMMHYFARPTLGAKLKTKSFYLIDSGGQYQGGTTDITRTLAMGELSEQEKIDYTLVLKGVINLSQTKFLKGTTGTNLDALARQPLWEQGIDYKCGTGHGVGYYLSVHEGPQNLSQSMKSNTILEPGMVLTIEPGVYRENQYGIRLENMVYVKQYSTTGDDIFYEFETLTLCPFDTTPICQNLLTQKEIKWINQYHQSVYKKLAPHLSVQEAEWLKQKIHDI